MNAKYLTLAIAACLVAALGYWYFFAATMRDIANYPSAGTDIIAFGDSLVAGVGATEGNDFVSVLSRRIGQPVVNLGVSGNTSEDGLARLSELDAHNPKVVLLLLGGNDYLRKVPLEQTFVNLAKIIESLQGRGAIVILLGVRGGLLTDGFEDEFEALAEQYNTAYVPDVLDGLFAHPQYMTDQVHPNDAGYAKIADRIAPVLTPLLQ